MSSFTDPIHRILSLLGLDVRLRRNLVLTRQAERREQRLHPWRNAFRQDFRVVLDIGANTGQFASLVRELLPIARVYCFEPLPDIARELSRNYANDPLVTPVNIALGAENGRQRMYRSAFSPSSSLLDMGDRHCREWPESKVLTPLEVDVVRLDDWMISQGLRSDSSWLAKLDVQGAEDSVLEGGAETFREVGAVVIEVSFVELYEGQPLFNDIHNRMTSLGFAYRGNIEQHHGNASQEILFADALYVNKKPDSLQMKQPSLLVTGAAGLIGSEAVRHFSSLGWTVHGIDNNMRADFFGPDGDTTWNLRGLEGDFPSYQHHDLDIRDREAILRLFSELHFDHIIHAAAQPSHDLAASRPFDDFDVNAAGTLNLLEATRRYCPESAFCFISTNKVYGDAPNELPLVELDTRYDYARQEDREGIDEQLRIDQSKHSLFGVSKLAADIYVQEYGRYFGMKTMCLRGGCLTGGAHSGAELHGFLAYLVRSVIEGRKYRIFGYKGKQVRDNIHSKDVCLLLERFFERPVSGEVYNIGGGRANSVSMLEAISKIETLCEQELDWTYVEEPRSGDHICYITNLAKVQKDFPGWGVTISLDDILDEIVGAIRSRAES